MPFTFEWDEVKRRKILEDRGVDLLDAALIFEKGGEIIEWRDERRDYGEDRIIAVGYADNAPYQVVYTWRRGNIRLITAWKISHEDFKKYKARYAQRIEKDEGSR